MPPKYTPVVKCIRRIGYHDGPDIRQSGGVKLRFLSMLPDLFDTIIGPHFTIPLAPQFFDWAVCTIPEEDPSYELRWGCIITSYMRQEYLARMSIIAKLRTCSRGLKYWVARYWLRDLWFVHPRQLERFLDTYWKRRDPLKYTRRLRVDIPMLYDDDQHHVLQSWDHWPNQPSYLGEMPAPQDKSRIPLVKKVNAMYSSLLEILCHLESFDNGYTGYGSVKAFPAPRNYYDYRALRNITSLRLACSFFDDHFFRYLRGLHNLQELVLDLMPVSGGYGFDLEVDMSEFGADGEPGLLEMLKNNGHNIQRLTLGGHYSIPGDFIDLNTLCPKLRYFEFQMNELMVFPQFHEWIEHIAVHSVYHFYLRSPHRLNLERFIDAMCSNRAQWKRLVSISETTPLNEDSRLFESHLDMEWGKQMVQRIYGHSIRILDCNGNDKVFKWEDQRVDFGVKI
ncbi:hypothetical protein M422DRAFT_70927 [Sphaerobolus stellatus SS14]|uniref:Uncharacterized protein n=1 Tax=Sphaerobolus stellatus (strain SS14) TaxID=990650 RepID=A0A0C9U955_SPHS4|nr:hypothetical protein M422DRAFT_70927 [Sphaerobolus stellatus SS14]